MSSGMRSDALDYTFTSRTARCWGPRLQSPTIRKTNLAGLREVRFFNPLTLDVTELGVDAAKRLSHRIPVLGEVGTHATVLNDLCVHQDAGSNPTSAYPLLDERFASAAGRPCRPPEACYRGDSASYLDGIGRPALSP